MFCTRAGDYDWYVTLVSARRRLSLPRASVSAATRNQLSSIHDRRHTDRRHSLAKLKPNPDLLSFQSAVSHGPMHMQNIYQLTKVKGQL